MRKCTQIVLNRLVATVNGRVKGGVLDINPIDFSIGYIIVNIRIIR